MKEVTIKKTNSNTACIKDFLKKHRKTRNTLKNLVLGRLKQKESLGSKHQ